VPIFLNSRWIVGANCVYGRCLLRKLQRNLVGSTPCRVALAYLEETPRFREIDETDTLSLARLGSILFFHSKFGYDRKSSKLTHDRYEFLDEKISIKGTLQFIWYETSLANRVSPERPKSPLPIGHLDSSLIDKTARAKRNPPCSLAVRRIS